MRIAGPLIAHHVRFDTAHKVAVSKLTAPFLWIAGISWTSPNLPPRQYRSEMTARPSMQGIMRVGSLSSFKGRRILEARLTLFRPPISS